MCHRATRKADEPGGMRNLGLPPGKPWQHSCCDLTMTPSSLDSLKTELRALVGADNMIDGGESLETLSKDFYWYSPVLKAQLESKKADMVVRPASVSELVAVAAACYRARVPVVPRGAGTGNYGQCVPLYGGVVVDMARMDKILSLDGGVARVEAGARLGTIEAEARKVGWELRCLPSTWVKSTMAGFFCGGSGGIGSITWGGINAPGNVKSMTILSVEGEPRLHRLEEGECLKALHTYGTTGIVTEVEMRLAPKHDYDQLIISSPDWEALLAWTDTAARTLEWSKRLVTQFEWPIPSYFKPLASAVKPGESVTFILVDRAQADEVVASAAAAKLACVYRKPLADPPRPPFLTDYTWNHTTLWAMKADPSITYLQCGFNEDFAEQFRMIHRQFPGEVLFHLEWTAGNAKMMKPGEVARDRSKVMVGGIPLVFYKSEERLNEIIAYCEKIDVFVANPHTVLLEEGGRHPNIADKRAFKDLVDPAALLNPGKMKTYPVNPFASSSA
jgi:FAD/FMN-containing dehydrogenase